jgi:GNAT superfamily N-acetyltransferase
MPLYFHSTSNPLPSIAVPEGLVIKANADIFLLATIGELSVEEVIRRIAAGNRAYVAFLHGRPAAFGWLATKTAAIGEIATRIQMPTGNGYLWNFRTLADYRGKGIYPALLQWILRHDNELHHFWIIHAPENQASEKGILKAGFRLAGLLSLNAKFEPTLEVNGLPASTLALIHAMGIPTNSGAGSSCWNCHSPYLKKKQSGCCCNDRNLACQPGRTTLHHIKQQQHEKAYLHPAI